MLWAHLLPSIHANCQDKTRQNPGHLHEGFLHWSKASLVHRSGSMAGQQGVSGYGQDIPCCIQAWMVLVSIC